MKRRVRPVLLSSSLLVLFLAIGCNRNSETSAAGPPDNNLAPVAQTEPAPLPAPENAPAPEPQAYGEPLTYAPQPPPPLPEYQQPPCPGENYIWTPGYWAYESTGYYWVPGAWVLAPYVDALWTPPYWDYYEGRYRWHHGYWGPYIGFCGGINYGFGYTG